MAKLSAHRESRLEAVPGWSWGPYEDSFRAGVAALQAFIAKYGDAKVPTDWAEDGYRLGTWCFIRRQQRKDGKLSRRRVEELDRLGFIWDYLEDDYAAALAYLWKFIAREGHAHVPQDHLEDRFRLGGWCSERRAERARGELRPERIEQLDQLGFVWVLRDRRFENGLQALKRFVSRDGNAEVRFDHMEGDFPLGSWVNNQRRLRRRGKVAAERIARLDQLGFVWEPFDKEFEDGLRAFESFVMRERNGLVPRPWNENGFALGRWCSNRRVDRKKGRLSADRVERLERLGFVWDVRGASLRMRAAAGKGTCP